MYGNADPDEASNIINIYTSEKPTAMYLVKITSLLYFIYIINAPADTAISVISGKTLLNEDRFDIFICETIPIIMNTIVQKCPITVSLFIFSIYRSLISLTSVSIITLVAGKENKELSWVTETLPYTVADAISRPSP